MLQTYKKDPTIKLPTNDLLVGFYKISEAESKISFVTMVFRGGLFWAKMDYWNIHTLRVHYPHAAANLNSGYS